MKQEVELFFLCHYEIDYPLNSGGVLLFSLSSPIFAASIHFCNVFPSAPQVPGDVLQSVPGNPAARQPLYQPLLHDAGFRDARTAVVRRHRLHQEDPGPGQVGAGGPRLLHEADERRSPWRLDYQDGLDLSHNPPARHELRWQLRNERSNGLWQQ